MPPPPLQHPRQHGTNAVESPLAIDLDGPLPLLLANILHHGVVHDARTVDEDVHRPEFVLRAPHERTHLPAVRNVGSRDDALLPIPTFETGLNVEQHILTPSRERDMRPFGIERPDHSGTNTARSSGHYRNPPPKLSAAQNTKARQPCTFTPILHPRPSAPKKLKC